MARPRFSKIKKCESCGKNFSHYAHNAKHCPECRVDTRNKGTKGQFVKICGQCTKSFKVAYSTREYCDFCRRKRKSWRADKRASIDAAKSTHVVIDKTFIFGESEYSRHNPFDLEFHGHRQSAHARLGRLIAPIVHKNLSMGDPIKQEYE